MRSASPSLVADGGWPDKLSDLFLSTVSQLEQNIPGYLGLNSIPEISAAWLFLKITKNLEQLRLKGKGLNIGCCDAERAGLPSLCRDISVLT